MPYDTVLLDPQNVSESVNQLMTTYNLAPEDRPIFQQLVALYPQPVEMRYDEISAILQQDMFLADKFTFEMETDTLVLFSRDKDALIDALVEMAMYLAGFATMMGTEDTWVIEFTIGTWKPIRKQIKRAIGIHVADQPRGVVGLPPVSQGESADEPYSFQKLVSNFDRASFYQMVVLGARDDIAVYFPPETHPNVMDVYVSVRRSIKEITDGLSLSDHQLFNTRLVTEIHKLQERFAPQELAYPNWLSDLADQDEMQGTSASSLGMMPPPKSPPRNDPFADFIDELFSDDED